MQYFTFVFTCSPTAPCLSENLLQQTGIFEEIGPGNELHWLAPRIACEISTRVTLGKAQALLLSLRNCLAGHTVDVNLVKAGAERQKLLIVADMDSTIIQQECIDELAAVAGVGDVIHAITERAMQGELDFESALRERVGLLRGLPVTAIEQVLNDRIKITDGAIEFIQTMRQHGAYCALVSGGFTAFTSVIAERVGFDTHQANSLEIVDGVLSGRVINPILGREAKLIALKNMLAARKLDANLSLAVGDGANDLAMINHAGLGCAFRAKPVVSAAADVAIEHCDLTGFLYLQGFSIDAFHTGTN